MPKMKLLFSSSLVLEVLKHLCTLECLSFDDVCGANENQTVVFRYLHMKLTVMGIFTGVL
jgi:hypothetical protein